MNVRVHIKGEDLHDERQGLLHEAASAALRQAGVEGVELSLLLTDDRTIRSLNRKYRDEDRATDVLAFPMGEDDPDSGLAYLGDVVISLNQAEGQAEAAGHPLANELALLAIHGVLHLCGHDHAEPEAKAEMWAAQDRALASLGIQVAFFDGS